MITTSEIKISVWSIVPRRAGASGVHLAFGSISSMTPQPPLPGLQAIAASTPAMKLVPLAAECRPDRPRPSRWPQHGNL